MLFSKHILLYLPYNAFVCQHHSGKLEAYKLTGLKYNHTTSEWVVYLDDSRKGGYMSSHIPGVKLVLRPMEEITTIQERANIETDLNQRLMDCEFKYLGLFREQHHLFSIHGISYQVDNLPNDILQLLAKYHYDVYNLLPTEYAYTKNEVSFK